MRALGPLLLLNDTAIEKLPSKVRISFIHFTGDFFKIYILYM